MSAYRIEATRTPRGSLIVDRPTGFAHDQFVAALADELEDEMRSDSSLQRVIVTIEVGSISPANPMSAEPGMSQP